jgi:hypothetical protein
VLRVWGNWEGAAPMQSWTLDQLLLADELCFPADFEEIMKEIAPDTWVPEMTSFKSAGGLLVWIRRYSRADMERGMGEVFDTLITRLLLGVKRVTRANILKYNAQKSIREMRQRRAAMEVVKEKAVRLHEKRGMDFAGIAVELNVSIDYARQLCALGKKKKPEGIRADIGQLSGRAQNPLRNLCPRDKAPSLESIVDEHSMRIFLDAIVKVDLLRLRCCGLATKMEIEEWVEKMKKKYQCHKLSIPSGLASPGMATQT